MAGLPNADEIFACACDEDHVVLAQTLAALSHDDLGVLIGACRRLTHAIRAELRARTQARQQAEADEARKADSDV